MREMTTEAPRYQIQSEGGQGLSATVLRATRIDSRGHSKQDVALKILKHGTPVSRLKREFEALLQIDSPHCVRALGWTNLQDGRPAIVMDWIEGLTLFDLARRGVLRQAAKVEIVAQIQLGLQALHRTGLAHGDLNPSNILIDRAGRVRLIDFSVHDPADADVTGTPAYMAPELWQKAVPGKATDLFALGLLIEDLDTQFYSAPHDAASARVRATEVAENDQLRLCRKNPEARVWMPYESCAVAREELAETVSRLLALQTFSPATVALSEVVVSPRSALPRFRIALSLCLMLLTSTVAVRAQAPLLETSAPARLSLRSHQWMEVSVNGRVLGFAPIDQISLLPGRHRIAWKTSRQSGERYVTVQPGESLWLTETELLRNH